MTDETILTGKRIVLGVTGSIAAYKAAILGSQLTQHGALVDVILTEAALQFVTPLTFEALTGRPAYVSLWETDSSGGLATHIAHVGLAHGADLLVIAPATAHTIAKLALGLADNLLTVTALAAQCPALIAPAMDAGMYDNAATQGHIETLQGRGVEFIGPGAGRMASGLAGLGRLAEPEIILGACRLALGKHGPLAGKRVVVTAGPTREALDPARYLSNHSSGKQGFAIAQAAIDAGATVTLIAGPVGDGLATPVGAERIDVTSAGTMRDAVLDQATGEYRADALIMAAAVSDFRPAHPATQKIKKRKVKGGPELPMTLELTENADILGEVSGQTARPHITVGFAAESNDLVENAQDKLKRKKLDMIVANDITASDAGFGVDTNRVLFITEQGVEELPLMSKSAVAARIVAWVAARLT